MTRDPLYGRLTRLAEKTKSAESLDPGGWWVGDAAGERRALDDLAAGRPYWVQAHNCALAGIEALEQGKREEAEAWAWEAVAMYTAALEIRLARIRPNEHRKALQRSSGRRGRPRKKVEK